MARLTGGRGKGDLRDPGGGLQFHRDRETRKPDRQAGDRHDRAGFGPLKPRREGKGCLMCNNFLHVCSVQHASLR